MTRPTAAGVLCAVAVAAVARADDPKPAKPPPHPLVFTQDGQLPVILSAPHGGTEPIPDTPERLGEGLPTGPSGFFTGRDVNTDLLAKAISAEVEKRLGKKPYLVVAKFGRKYVDANRPPEFAYESAAAKPVYDNYRDTLAAYCKEVQATFGRGLLLDVHGQGSARDTIFRGTQNGKTVSLLVGREGETAHTGPKSFFGLLAANGCKVFPEPGTDDKERAGFTGGHIVRSYGGDAGFGVDAIQLECGADYTDKDKRAAAAGKIAAAVEAFAKLYLPAEPLPGAPKKDK